jgi:hypothetical protein
MTPKRLRQRFLFPIHDPKPKPLPKVTEAEGAALIVRDWRKADGSPIPADQAGHQVFLFLRHLKYQPAPLWMEPRPRKRPERPTARRLYEFVAVETDWIRK